jgi:hypothetical protein
MKKNNREVSPSVAVLLPCQDKQPSDGLAFIYEDGWAKARRVRVMHAERENELMKVARENPGWVDFISGVKQLMASEENPNDKLLIPAAHAAMAPWLGLTSKAPTEFFKDAWFAVSGAIAFDGVRLTLWQKKSDEKGRMRGLLGLYCPDSKTAYAAGILLSPRFRICTHCHKHFLAQRSSQTACSVRCREAHRSARWYEANKQKRNRQRALKRRKEQAA